MKKVLLVFLLIHMSLVSKAQCTLPYKTLSQFNNDTTAFIKYNFSTRASCYEGKSLDVLLNDLKIPVKWVLPTEDAQRFDIYDGMYLYIHPYNDSMHNDYFGFPEPVIAIEWVDAINADDFNFRSGGFPHLWDDNSSTFYDFMRFRLIKEVGVVGEVK
ncbi:MAG: hypothetical protein Q8909_18560 [Bacteroidota bacterium]|nr:hypothetical protein [Bacteroidota bacterium]